MNKPANTDAYIASFPADVQTRLQQLRTLVKTVAPDAAEVISYGLPAFKQKSGMLVWYGAHTSHIGLYPRASAIEAFADKLKAYKFAKGSIQFPFNEPLPVDLITEIVKFRVAENMQKAKKK
ncbi:iron chaperone [Mucilaginibacter sp. AW1-3]